MKKNYFNKIILPLLAVLWLFSCGENANKPAADIAQQHGDHTQYTCPMHPQIIRDEPGTCPICGMDLVPMSSSAELHVDSSLLPLLKSVDQQVLASQPTVTPESGSRIFSATVQGVVTYDTRRQESVASRVAGRIERMYIKYNYQPVKKGQLIMEIYSPDLAAAQQELIYISRTDNNDDLIKRAWQRLSLLGMQAAQINQVIRTGKPLYRVPVYSPVSGYIVEKNVTAGNSDAGIVSITASSNGMGGMNASSGNTTQPTMDNSPVVIREGQYVGAGESVFVIYKDNGLVAAFSFEPTMAAAIGRGQKLLFAPVSDPNNLKTGTIGLIEPVQQNGKKFTVARVYLSVTDLKPGQLLTAKIPVVNEGGYWLSEKSVLQLGTKAIVFKKEGKVFVPTEVQTGIKANGMIEIKDYIGDWQVAANAGFLLDNESLIRLNEYPSK